MGAIAGPAQASSSVPYTDPAVTGALGLCDSQGHQITSGSTATQPFAALAVGSVAAPTDYTGTGRGAVLYAYQPIENVPANAWSGEELTDNSRYTNAAHPMSAATGGDPALQHVVTDFPPKWDGLIQLRLYATAPGRPMDSTSYQALDIKVSGTSWQAVDGTTVDCTAGSAVSVETTLLPKSRAAHTGGRTCTRCNDASDGSTHTVLALAALGVLLAAAAACSVRARERPRRRSAPITNYTCASRHLRERPLTMTSTLRRSVTAGVVGLLTAAAFVVLGGATATATTTPPWEPDANSVGGLLFFNAQGNQITGGIDQRPAARRFRRRNDGGASRRHECGAVRLPARQRQAPTPVERRRAVRLDQVPELGRTERDRIERAARRHRRGHRLHDRRPGGGLPDHQRRRATRTSTSCG